MVYMGLQLRPAKNMTLGKGIAVGLAMLALGIQPLLGVFGSKTADAASYGDVIVRAATTQGWSQANSVSGGTTSFVSDATAPYGYGALQLVTANNNDSKVQRVKTVSIKLSDIATLSYWTKQVSATNPTHAPSLQLVVNGLNGTASSTTLVFEPYWNTSGAAGVSKNLPNNTWQQWNVKDGLFWSTKTYASAGLQSGAGGPPFYSLAQVIANNPNAKVTTIALSVGSYNAGLTGLADGVNVNGVVYDFEPAEVAPAMPTGLTYAGQACGGYTNINYAQPKWDAVSGAVSYDYQALYNGSVVFSANYPTNQHPGGSFGGGNNGVWSFQVRSIGSTGLKSAWSPACDVTLDTVAPAAPTGLQWKTDSNVVIADGGITNRSAGTASWGAVADADHYIYKYWNDIPGNPYKIGSEYAPTTSGTSMPGVFNQGDGVHHFCVVAVDRAGNSSACTEFTITYDGTAPVATITAPADGSAVSGIVHIVGTVSDMTPSNSYVSIYKVGGGVVATSFYGDGRATHEFDWDTTGLAEGQYEIYFETRDKAGNKDGTLAAPGASVKKVTITLDRSAPVVTILNAVVNTDGTYTVSGTTDDDTSPVTVVVDGESLPPVTASGGAWSVKTGVLLIGQHQISASSTDAAGNTGAATPAPYVVTVRVPGGNAVFVAPVNATAPAAPPAAPSRQASSSLATTTQGGDQSVLGAETVVSDGQPVSTGAATDQEVKGISDTKAAKGGEGWSFWGIAWYWWLILLAVVAFIWWWLIAAWRRRQSEESY